MSPELETLDQLLGGDLPLQVIAGLYPDDARFVYGLSGLLGSGEVLLVRADGAELPEWQWQKELAAPTTDVLVRITQAGARRIG